MVDCRIEYDCSGKKMEDHSFIDDHVEAIRWKSLLLDRSDRSLRRWNNDDEPHRELLGRRNGGRAPANCVKVAHLNKVGPGIVQPSGLSECCKRAKPIARITGFAYCSKLDILAS